MLVTGVSVFFIGISVVAVKLVADRLARSFFMVDAGLAGLVVFVWSLLTSVFFASLSVNNFSSAGGMFGVFFTEDYFSTLATVFTAGGLPPIFAVCSSVFAPASFFFCSSNCF